MNFFIKTLVSISVLLFMTACSTVGNKSLDGLTEDRVNQSITVGKTTMLEVKKLYGSPFATNFTDGGLTVWTYMYDDTSALTAETIGSVVLTLGLAGTKARGTRNELVVLFDDKNVVKKYHMSNSPIESGTGVF